MLAAVFKRSGVLEIEDRPQPKGLEGEEVSLEVEGSGVCSTDLHILRGYSFTGFATRMSNFPKFSPRKSF